MKTTLGIFRTRNIRLDMRCWNAARRDLFRHDRIRPLRCWFTYIDHSTARRPLPYCLFTGPRARSCRKILL